MNIYKVSSSLGGYDTYDSFICFAESEEDARRMGPNEDIVWSDEWDRFTTSYDLEAFDEEDGPYANSSWREHKDRLKVELIARDIDASPGIILSSFNAG